MASSIPNFEKKSDQLWWEIQDIIGPAGNWPKWIVDLFFTRNLTHGPKAFDMCICNIQRIKPRSKSK